MAVSAARVTVTVWFFFRVLAYNGTDWSSKFIRCLDGILIRCRGKLSSSSLSSSLNQPRSGVLLSSSSFSGEKSESLVRFAIVELIVRGDTSEVLELFGISSSAGSPFSMHVTRLFIVHLLSYGKHSLPPSSNSVKYP